MRIALGSLRAIVRGAGRDRIAIFGKRTKLLLTYRAGCPVVANLEDRCGVPHERTAP